MRSSLFEFLEQRLQFSTSEVVGQDTLNVFGTGGKDNISVDMMDFVQDGSGRVFHATVNGDRESYETELITHINIFGVNGNDHIDLNGLPIGVKTIIYGGPGNDTLTAGDIRGEVKFLAGGGTNRVDALGSTFDEAGIFYPIEDYLFDGKGIKDGANGITWTPGTVQKVTFEADAGDDTLDVTAVPAGQTLSLTGNGGDDLFKVGNGDIAAHIRGSLNINGSVFTPPNASEKNTIVLDDSKSDGGVDQFAIGSFKTLAMSNAIKFKNIDHFTLNASNDNDIINVTSSSASEKAIQINARGGNDFVSVGSASIGLASVKSTAIAVDGGSGNDVVSADDRLTPGFNSYVVSAGGFSRGGTTSWSTSHIERFDLFASAGGSTINAFGSSVPVDLFGGNGNDIMYGSIFNDVLIGGAGNDQLSGLQGNDSLAGGTGNDLLHGNAGNDTLDGGTGNDSLAGGADQDQLFGNDGEKDSLDGGAGNDTFHKDSKDIFTTIP